MHFVLGSDPELMLCDINSKELVSAIPIITEGKGEGRPLGKTKESSVIHDNVNIELNTKPARSEKEFVKTIGMVLREVDKIVSKHNLEMKVQASANFPKKELEHPEAIIFGCDPDFNAWKLDMNEVPAGSAQKPFRSAGGHLHIGMGDNQDLNDILSQEDGLGKVDVVKILDIFCGIPSVFIDKDPTSAARRALYGGAGAHRPKSYGVEYRALGNWWLMSPDHTSLVYQLTEAALSALVDGQLPKLIEAIGEGAVQNIINKSQVEAAKKAYLKVIKKYVPSETHALLVKLNRKKSFDFYSAWGIK